jgi:uncharacterized protein (TIGR03437 family)
MHRFWVGVALCIALAFLAPTPRAPGAELVYAVGAGSAPANLPNFVGGYLTDSVNGIAVDSQGFVYITGSTFSPEFPRGKDIPSAGWFATPRPRRYMFVAKLGQDGSRFLYVRLFEGGSSNAIAVDAAGNAYVAGYGPLSNLTETYRAGPLGGGLDAFVLKLDSSGARIVYLAYLGGRGGEAVYGLALDRAGNVYLGGGTDSTDFPVTPGAIQSTNKCTQPSCSTAFVSKLNAFGTALVYSTLLGGTNSDRCRGIAVDMSGAAHVAGGAYSSDFPVTAGSFQTRHNPPSPYGFPIPDVFVVKLNPSGSALVYGTFLGGRGEDLATGIALDPVGNAYVTGYTSAGPNFSAPTNDYPVTPGAFQTAANPSQQTAFVSKLDPRGAALVYSTFLVPSQANLYPLDSQANAIALDSDGNAYITGSTAAGLPVLRAFQPAFYGPLCPVYSLSGSIPISYNPCSDAFVAALDASGSGLLYSTYLNGYLNDSGLAIAVDGQGNTYAAGHGALSLAATNPISNNGGAFVVKLSNARTPPFFTRESITNSAGFVSGLVLPGGLATIFCANLTGIRGVVQASGFPLPTELAGVRVKISGVAAPLLAVADVNGQQQINLQVPFEAATNPDPLDVEVSQDAASAWVVKVRTKSTAPGIFTMDGGYGAIQHGADYTLVTPASPAQRGEVIIVYATGLGWVDPAVPSGMPAPRASFQTRTTPRVAIGGTPAEVLFSGLTPGFAGLYQVNVRVPDAVASGDQDVVVSFPPFQECCVAGTFLQTVRVDSEPVKLSVR